LKKVVSKKLENLDGLNGRPELMGQKHIMFNQFGL